VDEEMIDLANEKQKSIEQEYIDIVKPQLNIDDDNYIDESRKMILEKVNRLFALMHYKRTKLKEITSFINGSFEIYKYKLSTDCCYYSKYFIKNTCLDGSIFYEPASMISQSKNNFIFLSWIKDVRNLRDFYTVCQIRDDALNRLKFLPDDMEKLNSIYVKYKNMPVSD
jgi:hypothetical protein